VQRARALLLAAEGMANIRIVDRVGVSPATVTAWRSRFAEQGLARLGQVRKGRGGKSTIRQATIDEIVELTRNSGPDGETHWSCHRRRDVGVYTGCFTTTTCDDGDDPGL